MQAGGNPMAPPAHGGRRGALQAQARAQVGHVGRQARELVLADQARLAAPDRRREAR